MAAEIGESDRAIAPCILCGVKRPVGTLDRGFEAVVGEEIAAEDEDEDVDSLGGLVFTLIGRVPERGEVIRHPTGYEFEVIEADSRRIKRMRVRAPHKRPKPATSDADTPDAS